MHIIIVGQGLHGTGGVPTVARWLGTNLAADPSFTYQMLDLATSATDENSRRMLAPSTWSRSTLFAPTKDEWVSVGANAVEVEAARYLPRKELTQLLRGADVIQIVAGGPALANVAIRAERPIVIQAATLSAWERASGQADARGLVRRLNQPIINALERRALKCASAVLVENQQMGDFVSGMGQRRVVIAPPGVDCHEFRPGDTEWDPDGPLLSVCRLGDVRKGIERLVRAYRILVDSSEERVPSLILAGAGSLPSEVTSLIKNLDLMDRVEVRADVPQDSLRDLYQASSCFVQSSYEEGLGLSSVEAMACGVPVVASTTAGSREVVEDAVTGFLVPEGQDFELRFAQAVQSVLVGRGREFARAARERALWKFSMESTFEKYRGTYRELYS